MSKNNGNVIRLGSALAISLGLGLASLYLVAPDLFDHDLRSIFGRLNFLALAGMAVPVLLWWLLSGWRIVFLTARTAHPTTFWQGVQTHILGTFSAVATPSGGGNSIGIVFLLNRFGLPANEAVAVAVMCVVGDLAFFGWAAPASYLALRFTGVQLPLEQLGVLVAALSAVAILASYLLVFRLPLAIQLLRRATAHRFLRRFHSRTDSFLKDLSLASRGYSSRPWHWHLRFHLLSGAARLPYFAVLNLVLIGLLMSAEHGVVYTVQIVLHAFAFLVPTPGASGYQEAAITYALRGQVSGGALAVAVLIWRFFQHYLYFLLGPLIGGLALAGAGRRASVEEGE
ncbi:MAG: lysylphosphatidylglycerol synthase transmembrane domain-containing protein [Trueperaceae bacterium]